MLTYMLPNEEWKNIKLKINLFIGQNLKLQLN